MNKRIKHLLIILVMGLCLSMPLTVSAEADSTIDDPGVPASEQCPNTTHKSTQSTTVVEDEGATTDSQPEGAPDNDCTEWQTAPVSWNS